MIVLLVCCLPSKYNLPLPTAGIVAGILAAVLMLTKLSLGCGALVTLLLANISWGLQFGSRSTRLILLSIGSFVIAFVMLCLWYFRSANNVCLWLRVVRSSKRSMADLASKTSLRRITSRTKWTSAGSQHAGAARRDGGRPIEPYPRAPGGGARRRLRVRQLAIRQPESRRQSGKRQRHRAARRELRRHAPADLARHRHRVQARRHDLRQKESDVPESQRQHDLLPDFSKETPVKNILPVLDIGHPPTEWADRIRQMSAVFLSSADLQNSDVTASETRGTHYYVNSEGFETIEPIRSASLRVSADTQTADGTAIRDTFSVVQNSLQEMPPAADLVARTHDLATRLTVERTAPLGEDYTGPILVEGEASAQLISETLVPLMLARRPPDSDAAGGRGGQAPQNAVTPFLTRIGLRVLPDAFSVSDTPSLKQYGGKPVPGAYLVDDEGVPAKDVTLVENGKLVTLLTDRTPQKKLLQSNGHGRSGNVQAGVFQMRSSQAVPASDLKTKYLDVLKDQDKEFGYIVRGIGNAGGGPGGGSAGPPILQAVRVTLDGKEQPVRGLRLAPIASTVFRNILDASDERVLYSYMTGSGDAVSVIVPSMIYEELELQQTRDIVQKPPIVPSPLGN